METRFFGIWHHCRLRAAQAQTGGGSHADLIATPRFIPPLEKSEDREEWEEGVEEGGREEEGDIKEDEREEEDGEDSAAWGRLRMGRHERRGEERERENPGA